MPIPIQSLSEELGKTEFVRGKTVFGSPSDCFDEIACNHENMSWWLSENGLNMTIVESSLRTISKFDELAGRLMYEARPRRQTNGRLPLAECQKIAIALDEGGFKPLKHLERTCRNKLARWNQKYSKRAVHTFQEVSEMGATIAELACLRRGFRQSLTRAEFRWRRFMGLPL